MTKCPKCGSSEISGPRYGAQVEEYYSHEGLYYTCRRCGFTKAEPTLDAKKLEE
jgi:predicted Zn-ribbon and HTH transcriptional regulator